MNGTGMRVLAVLGLAGVLAVSGCETQGQTAALMGSVIGAGLGQAIGGDTESTLIGGALGGGIGYMMGNEEDKRVAAQQREIDRQYTAEQIEVARQMANTEIINVRNSNGSYTPVTVQRYGGTWVGPRGEHYPGRPTEDQLATVYGF
ncbi:MAG TPA: glycine zipper domain-containing protein [Planctomycetota bacterium]|nr:glycine zipper domain-containing protein [Planctomycetota bacterium]